MPATRMELDDDINPSAIWGGNWVKSWWPTVSEPHANANSVNGGDVPMPIVSHRAINNELIDNELAYDTGLDRDGVTPVSSDNLGSEGMPMNSAKDSVSPSAEDMHVSSADESMGNSRDSDLDEARWDEIPRSLNDQHEERDSGSDSTVKPRRTIDDAEDTPTTEPFCFNFTPSQGLKREFVGRETPTKRMILEVDKSASIRQELIEEKAFGVQERRALRDKIRSQRTLYIAKINELQLQLQEGLQAMEERNAEFQKTLLRVEAEHQTVVQNLHAEVDRIRIEKANEMATIRKRSERQVAAAKRTGSRATAREKGNRQMLAAYALEAEESETWHPLFPMTEDNQDPVTDNPDPQESVKFEGGNSSQKVTDITAIVEEVVRRLQGSNIATKPLSTRKRQQKKEVWEEDHEERLEQLAAIRQLFKEVFDVSQDEDFAYHQEASSQQVHDFINGTGDGPDPNDPRLDMKEPLTNGWNKEIAKILLEKFRQRQKILLPHLRVPPRSDAYLEKLIMEKLVRCRYYWIKSRPQRNGEDQWETPEQVEIRLITKKEQMLHAQRQETRRNNKFNRRVKIVEHRIRNGPRSQVVVWTWLRKMLQMLGQNGMSSEESEIEEETETLLRVKRLPWRRNISRELDYVDTHRVRDPNSFGKQGSKPLRRRRGDENLISTRAPVRGLPAAFYNRQWLEQECSIEVQRSVSDVPFKWMNLVFEEDGGEMADRE